MTAHLRPWRPWQRWARFCWRHQVGLAAGYLGFVALLVASPVLYLTQVSGPLDVGATVALRSLAHGRTFEPVEEARRDLAAGQWERAEQRLTLFLARHGDTQPGQLYTQAVSDASELLAGVYQSTGRTGKAHRTLRDATARTPRNWWLWYLRGQAATAAADPEDAAASLREAFRQTLVVPEVLEALLKVLEEQGRHEDILWAFDHFERARTRCAPFVQAKAGPGRPALHRRVLTMAGIPIEHGDFLGGVEVQGLPRGEGVGFLLPGALFDRCPDGQDSYLQLRFQNLFSPVTVHALTLVREDGGLEQVALTPEQIATSTRPHTGGDSYVEVRGRFPWAGVVQVRVHYSTDALEPSEAVGTMVANARRIVTARSAR